MQSEDGIPQPSLRRLPVYYRRLLGALQAGTAYVSSVDLGKAAGVPGAQVRKDLSYLKEEGRPGVGYHVRSLAEHLEEYLGLVYDKEAVLVGVGNLGRALVSYPGFESYGLRIVALFDSDAARYGLVINGLQVLPESKLVNLVQRLHIQIGIITVPAEAAQSVAEKMVSGGISVIWNFAPCTLSLPEHVLVKNQDLAVELATLSHHIARRRLEQNRADAGAAAVNHSDPSQG